MEHVGHAGLHLDPDGIIRCFARTHGGDDPVVVALPLPAPAATVMDLMEQKVASGELGTIDLPAADGVPRTALEDALRELIRVAGMNAGSDFGYLPSAEAADQEEISEAVQVVFLAIEAEAAATEHEAWDQGYAAAAARAEAAQPSPGLDADLLAEALHRSAPLSHRRRKCSDRHDLRAEQIATEYDFIRVERDARLRGGERG